MIYSNHPFIELIRKNIELLPNNAIVLDIGTSQRYAKELAPLKPQLQSKIYFALGYRPKTSLGENNCDLSADTLNLPIKSSTINAVICLEVIEHVRDPFIAIDQIYRILKPGGTLILTTPFLYPYHGKSSQNDNFSHGSYPDFWRFTHQGLEVLTRQFKKSTVYPASSTGQYYRDQLISFLPTEVRTWFHKHLHYSINQSVGNSTFRHLLIATK